MASSRALIARSKAGHVGREVKAGRAGPEAARRAQYELAAAKAADAVDAYVTEMVARAPELSPEQADLIGRTLRDALATKPTTKRRAS